MLSEINNSIHRAIESTTFCSSICICGLKSFKTFFAPLYYLSHKLQEGFCKEALAPPLDDKAYQLVHPPSTTIFAPFTNEDAGEARKRIGPLISSE